MSAIELPIKTVAGLNAREYFRVRAKRVRMERESATYAVKGMHRPDLPIVVTMTRLSPGSLDSDNLQGAFKAIRDGVADAYGIPDNDARIEWRYGQEKCKSGNYGVRISIEAMP